MRIIIAEDDTIPRMILKTAVESLGHECISCIDGLDAWTKWQSEPSDVIISDWIMPGLDGLELCHRIRESSLSSYTYFIVLSTLADRAHYLEGMQAGADDYLTKPLNVDELRVRLISAHRVTELHKRLATQNDELEQLNRKLREEGRRDALTGVGNRLRLNEDIQARMRDPLLANQASCIALCDIDRFKKFNDGYGHMAGDQALRAVASRIAENAGLSAGVYRFGGEEFVILFPDEPMTGSLISLNRIRLEVQNLEICHAENPPYLVVTISAGLAQLSALTPELFDAGIKRADAALYRAKEQGRNRVVVG
jgi:diguanylate cyclase (GGDEF)-like protein